MKDYEDEAFDDIEKAQKRRVAHGVTDGSLWRKRQEPVAALESVLCNPEGRCCIIGSEADRAIVDAALDELKKTLAQPEQETVAWIYRGVRHD